ncbi:MAG: hypothetical protein ABMB14_35385, partial [Myxococcota bacterium]
SRVVAECWRVFAGGANPADLAAWFGLVTDPAAALRVSAAAAAFEDRAGAAYQSVLARPR